MPDDFDLRVAIDAALADEVDWESVKRLVQALAANWLEPLKSGDGYAESELAETEDRLGLPIPATLREAYALFGKRGDLIGITNPLNSPENLYIQRPGDLGNQLNAAFLIYRNEDSGVWNGGVRVTDAGCEDPPTVFLNTCADAICMKEGVLWLDKMSTAIIEIVLTQLIAGNDADDGFYRSTFIEAERCHLVDQAFFKLDVPTFPRGIPPCHYAEDWYADADVILQLIYHPFSNLSGRTELLQVRGRTEEAINAALARLPQQWFE